MKQFWAVLFLCAVAGCGSSDDGSDENDKIAQTPVDKSKMDDPNAPKAQDPNAVVAQPEGPVINFRPNCQGGCGKSSSTSSSGW